MRRIALVALSAAVLAGAGCAQTESWFGGSEQSAAPISSDQLTSVARLEPREMVGKEVLAINGEKLGEVEDVILARGGGAHELVVGSGGVLGLGEREVALDVNDVRFEPQRNALVATKLSKDQFAALPEFRYDNSMTSLNRSQPSSSR